MSNANKTTVISSRTRLFNCVESLAFHTDEDCWNWIGAKSKDGHGMTFIHRGKTTRAHRLSWMIFKGDIPEGLLVLHKCDNAGCVNPAHLYLGTNLDNARDRVARNRSTRSSGSLNPQSKLLESDIPKICQMSKEGYTITGIALYYNVTRTLIRLIIQGKSWKHVAR